MVVPEPVPIAFCITDLDAGGAERALVQIVTQLPGDEWRPKVFCLSGPGELMAPLEASGVPVECLRAKSWRSFGVIRKLATGLRDWEPQLLQTFLFHANLAGRFAAWRARVPVVVCGLRVAERDAPWRMRLDRWSQRLVTHNVAVSRGVADFAVSKCGHDDEKLSVIPNGVDFDFFLRAAPSDLSSVGVPAGARVLTFVGRLHPQKAPELLVQAVAPRLKAERDLHLLLVGEGPLRSALEEQVAEFGLAEQVHLAGRQQNVAGMLKASTTLVLPSRWEGMPNVVLEAMAAGCPVIASDVEGSEELIENGRTGRLFSCGSTSELAAAVDQNLDHPEAAHELAIQAQHSVREQFTWENVAQSYGRLYHNLLSGG